mmetsp:Transcript_3755/g.15227  ORF Transcript_3755/g.15227 Transcript_3755/m.15227 type:complete len:220 (-) Transcript_3755:955-1614(-)
MRQSRRLARRRVRRTSRTRSVPDVGPVGTILGVVGPILGDEPPEPRAHAGPSPVPVRGGPARGAVGRVPEQHGEEVPRRRLGAKLRGGRRARVRLVQSQSFNRREVRGAQTRELKARAPEPEQGAVRAVRGRDVVGHRIVGHRIVQTRGWGVQTARISTGRARPPRDHRAIAASPRADGARERNLQRGALGVHVAAPRGGREPLEDDGSVWGVRRPLVR